MVIILERVRKYIATMSAHCSPFCKSIDVVGSFVGADSFSFFGVDSLVDNSLVDIDSLVDLDSFIGAGSFALRW